jgi:predicted porin
MSRLEDEAGVLIFDADLLDLRLTWQFSVRTFVRLTMQQQKVERNLAEYIDPETDAHTESRGMQFLYSYQLNPQTVVYAGYSDNHIDNDDLDSLTKTDRTLFLKVSYAWIPG